MNRLRNGYEVALQLYTLHVAGAHAIWFAVHTHEQFRQQDADEAGIELNCMVLKMKIL